MTKQKHAHDDMLSALKFISAAQNQVGMPHTRHCVLWGGWALGMNGTLSAGARLPLDEGMVLAPNTQRFLAAIERCAEHVAMTAMKDTLVVRSGKLKLTIPCHPLDMIPNIAADPIGARYDDDKLLRAALEAASLPATEGSPNAAYAGVYLTANLCYGTNGHVAVEAWHGLPAPSAIIPKSSVKTVLSEKRKIIGIGASNHSVTFHYEDESWLKTQLYEAKYPAVEAIFKGQPTNPWPAPKGFYDAVRSLLPFVNDSGSIYFGDNYISTTQNPELGSTAEVAGLKEGYCFSAHYLLMLEPIGRNVDFGKAFDAQANNGPTKNIAVFYGDNVRAALAPMRYGETVAAPPPPQKMANVNGVRVPVDMDDDIPF